MNLRVSRLLARAAVLTELEARLQPALSMPLILLFGALSKWSQVNSLVKGCCESGKIGSADANVRANVAGVFRNNSRM